MNWKANHPHYPLFLSKVQLDLSLVIVVDADSRPGWPSASHLRFSLWLLTKARCAEYVAFSQGVAGRPLWITLLVAERCPHLTTFYHALSWLTFLVSTAASQRPLCKVAFQFRLNFYLVIVWVCISVSLFLAALFVLVFEVLRMLSAPLLGPRF